MDALIPTNSSHRAIPSVSTRRLQKTVPILLGNMWLILLQEQITLNLCSCTIPPLNDSVPLLASSLLLDGPVSQPALLRGGGGSVLHGRQLPSSSAAERPPRPRLLQMKAVHAVFLHSPAFALLQESNSYSLCFDIEHLMNALRFTSRWISPIVVVPIAQSVSTSKMIFNDWRDCCRAVHGPLAQGATLPSPWNSWLGSRKSNQCSTYSRKLTKLLLLF